MFLRSAALALCIVATACEASRESSEPLPTQLVLADSTEYLDKLAREGMVVQHPGGTLFASGYGDTLPHLWKSGDNGVSWAAINVASFPGAAGNSDVDLAISRDGTLYLMTMEFNRTTNEGTGVHVAVSHDTGSTWVWHELSKSRFDDRPWIDVAPNGVAHAIWNDGTGVSHAMSTDRGLSWVEGDRVFRRGGSSHLAVGPNGEIAVRGVPLAASGNAFDAGADSIAVSLDQGATWQRFPAPGHREWFPMRDTTVSPPTWSEPEQPRWVEPIAWDSTGALYSFWGDGLNLMLARSTDRGATWSSWIVATSAHIPFFPYMIARGDGDVAASWFSGTGDSLRGNLARITIVTDTAAPRVALGAPFQVEAFRMASPDAPEQRDTGGEYLALIFLQNGDLGVIAPIQNWRSRRAGFAWRRYREER
jgi:hypothetical protein